MEPIRQQVLRYEGIPSAELPARLAEAFAQFSPEAPRASVIIPVFNKFEYTARCLLSLAALTDRTPFEIIVVDDGSTDETQQVLAELPGLRFHRNPENLGFVDSCNAGARLARGNYLVFLNNDTLVVPGWIEALEDTFTARQDCGLVGSMLIYPNMSLQEAGGQVFRDGSASNRGKGQDIGDPNFNFLRPVDYCSGASIMISAGLFKEIGEFDTRYRPAYYEDTDLAFAVRRAGLQVYYQSASKVVHFEGITAGKNTSQGVKAFQVTNRLRFCEKWKDVLARQPERYELSKDQVLGGAAGRILVIDNQTPKPDRDSGSLDMFNTLRIMARLGYVVDYLPLYRPKFVPRYTSMLQKEGIRCLHRPYFLTLRRFLKQNQGFDIVFISRIKIIKKAYGLVRRLAPKAKIIFNTVDLNFLRVGRGASVEHSRKLQ
ncbi:MAG: glycosyltransferase family 2 protein, partial [Holophaga sp.]|nr:glycosyltransferase family 2 protein [Holophaga sp.]